MEGSWRLGRLVLVSGIAARIENLTVLRSDADPYVPTTHTDRLALLLGNTPVIVPGAGHFLASDGITSVPQVLDALTRQG